MPYMNFKDLNMFYEDMGCGEPILFLHSHFSRSLLASVHRYSHFRGNTAACFRISADMDARNAKAWNGIPAKLPMIWQTF